MGHLGKWEAYVLSFICCFLPLEKFPFISTDSLSTISVCKNLNSSLSLRRVIICSGKKSLFSTMISKIELK